MGCRRLPNTKSSEEFCGALQRKRHKENQTRASSSEGKNPDAEPTRPKPLSKGGGVQRGKRKLFVTGDPVKKTYCGKGGGSSWGP